MGKVLATLGLGIGLIALPLQAALTIPLRMANGHNALEAVIFLISFFTVLSNIAAVLVYAGILFPGRFRLFDAMTGRLARAAVACCITVVGLVYATVLAKIWAPEGLFWLCDILLHYVAPTIYVFWWAIWGRDGGLIWSEAIKLLPAPLFYLAYALTRGALTGTYPYPFLDATSLGSAQVALNCLGVAALFLIVSLIAVAIDRTIPLSRHFRDRP